MSENKPARRIALTLLACGLVFPLGAATASAQSPARGGYDGTNVISTLPVLGERGTGALPPQRGVTRESGANKAVGGTLGVSAAGDPPAGDPPAATRRGTGAGTLPFTGFEGGLVGLMGLALIATGFALRRAGSVRD